MKRSGLFGLILLFLAFVLVGCGATTVNLNEIDIDAVDQIDILAGTYTVEYTIEDLSDLVKNYNATVVIVALNRAGQEVTVSGNSFTVEANEEYTVTIRLTVGEEIKEKTITITAITIIETTVSVSFDLAGGEGSFPVQTVATRGFAVRPTTDPTKADHLFLGWFGSQFDTLPFDFEHMMIYTDTILTARWEEVVSDQRKVTYDLNGAIQTEEWFEMVVQGNLASGPIVNPIRQGHLFSGWAYDADGLTMFDFATTTIQADLTLYAVWHVDFDVIVDADAFDGARAIHAFDLVEGNVLQQYELFANVLLSTLEYDHDLEEDRVEYGVLLGRDNTAMTYYSRPTEKLVGDLGEDNIDGVMMLTFRILTENLIEEAVYFYRFYIRYEQTIVYSNVLELQTMDVVTNGTAVGLDNVLSGGVYKLDNGTTQWRPQILIGVASGYEAQVDEGAVYTGYFNMYREGVRSIITTDLQTGKRYLHVFVLDFQTPHVVVAHAQTVTVGSDITPTFGIIFPHLEQINYPNPVVGVVYSKSTSFLKLGMPGVSSKSATMNADEISFTVNSPIQSSDGTLYIRGYAVMNGKTSYSNYVYQLEKNLEGVYEVVKSIEVYSEKMAPDQNYSWSFGPTAVVRVYHIVDNEWQFTSYQNSIDVRGIGQYFVVMVGVDYINDVLIVDDFEIPSGIEDGKTYKGSVLVSLDVYNQGMYMSYNGGDYVYLPSTIRLVQAGVYEVFYQTATGYQSMTFTITEQAQ
jgi:uncharacterized repeat protein (TIGR02543 family)